MTFDALVWTTANGEKWHETRRCANHDPERTIGMTLKDAVREGYEPCGQCSGHAYRAVAKRVTPSSARSTSDPTRSS